jgi:lipoyl-dependent peroxiredoxin
MPTRNASAVWEGGLRNGKGSFSGEMGTASGEFTAGSRFGEGVGTNPEELLAAAHASCYSMAFSGQLEKAGHPPTRIQTDAACSVEKVGDGYTITTMRLKTRARVPGIDEETFIRLANVAKEGCPVSRALTGVTIELDAKLES